MGTNVKISDVQVKTSSGGLQSISEYQGTVLLIVNVASRCGFTKQYAGLQELQNAYEQKGFKVLAFPCNDFGSQEPGSLKEIQTFCSNNFSVTFPLFEKVHAKGDTTEPFTTLNKSEPAGDVAWNFEKFLISKDGIVLARFKSSTEPESVELKNAIEEALKD